ncbi:hypothetical protein [Paractinoplanes hotanensis]|uniref:DUF5666 domain-containing protein n=1 Tax=Paractinoplanes hotanensis TaxID=2906497 RepID=A0ABT0Y0W1_9ACTN|nr:hypothetical protein [Actinoplanes hotanensis]MCM4079661.1 hypothetical protein [Actinoplanes hotanensis]
MTPTNDDTVVLAPGDRDDGLAAELAKAAPRHWWNKGTVVLGALVVLTGGFVGGLQVQKNYGTADTPAAARPGAFAGGQNRAGYGAAAGALPNLGGQATAAAAAPTTGKVKLVNGTTIYIEKSDGSVVTVKTDGKTTVSTAATSKLSDVKAGQSVTVQGATGSDGTVTATAVTATK